MYNCKEKNRLLWAEQKIESVGFWEPVVCPLRGSCTGTTGCYLYTLSPAAQQSYAFDELRYKQCSLPEAIKKKEP